MLSTSGGPRVPRLRRFRSYDRFARRMNKPGGPCKSRRLRFAQPLLRRVSMDVDPYSAKRPSTSGRRPPSLHRSTLADRRRCLAAPSLLCLCLASGLAGGAVQQPALEPDWVVVYQGRKDEDDSEDDDEDDDEQGGEEGEATDVPVSNTGICVVTEHKGVARILSRTGGFLRAPSPSFAEWHDAGRCGRGELCTAWKMRTPAVNTPGSSLQRPPTSQEPVRQTAQGVLLTRHPGIRRYTRLVARQIHPRPRRPAADTARTPPVRLSPSTDSIPPVNRGRSPVVAVTDGLVTAPTTVPRQALVNPDAHIGSSANGGIILGAVVSAAIAIAAVIVVWMVVKRVRKMQLPATEKGTIKDGNAFPQAFQIMRELPKSGSVPSFARAASQAGGTSGARSIMLETTSTGMLSNAMEPRAPFVGRVMIYAHARTPSQATGTSYASSSRKPGLEWASKIPRWGYADRPPAGLAPSYSTRPYQYNSVKRAEDWASSEAPSFTSAASFCSSSSSFSSSSIAAAGGASLCANRSMPNLPLPSYRYDHPHRGTGGWHHSAISASALSLPTLLSEAPATHSTSSRTWASPTTAADRIALARVRMLLRGDDADDRSVVNWKKVHAAAARSGNAG